MTLRTKLLLLLFTLFAGLGSTQWILLRSLTAELHEEAGAAAFEVGSQVASALGYSLPLETIQPASQLDEGPSPEAQSVPWSKIEPQGDALILTTSATRNGDREVNLRLGSGEETTEGRSDSTPMLRLEPAQTIAKPIPIPRQGFNQAFERYASSLGLGFLFLMGVGLVAAGWMALRVAAPLRELSEAARRLGDGELGLQVSTEGSVEFSDTARAFNRMSNELQRYEREAREHREREHLSEIGELARAMAHSLRNPLNALGLTLEQHERELVARGDDWSEAAGARAQLRRMEAAVRSLLSITGSDGTEVEELRIDLLARDVALEVLQDFGGGLEIEVLGEPLPVSLNAVRPELRAVLHTLLVNAAEASASDGRVEISIAERAEGALQIEVRDRGRGLEARIEGELFKPHATTKSSGTGMGLFLARRIVEARYAGSLELEPREGGGVCARLGLHVRTEDHDA